METRCTVDHSVCWSGIRSNSASYLENNLRDGHPNLLGYCRSAYCAIADQPNDRLFRRTCTGHLQDGPQQVDRKISRGNAKRERRAGAIKHSLTFIRNTSSLLKNSPHFSEWFCGEHLVLNSITRVRQ